MTSKIACVQRKLFYQGVCIWTVFFSCCRANMGFMFQGVCRNKVIGMGMVEDKQMNSQKTVPSAIDMLTM